MNILIDLFLGFIKAGSFAFGGAYAVIPIIRDIVMHYGWLTDEALSYMVAVSECTPGSYIVNLATYIGSTQAGFLGALIATIAVNIPSFIIVVALMKVLDKFLTNHYIKTIMDGLKNCVIGVILAIGCFMMYENSLAPTGIAIKPVAIALILIGISYLYKHFVKKKLSPVVLIMCGAILGILIF